MSNTPSSRSARDEFPVTFADNPELAEKMHAAVLSGQNSSQVTNAVTTTTRQRLKGHVPADRSFFSADNIQ